MKRLRGNTYVIQVRNRGALLNAGFSGGVLIDCGIGPQVAEVVVGEVRGAGERVEYLLNTHAHMDHTGGNRAARALTGAVLLATREQQPYIEQADLLEIFAYGARPVRPASGGAFDGWETARVDRVVEPGALKLGRAGLELIPSQGHSLDHCFIATQDGVLFCGDVLLSEELMEQYRLHFLLDVGETLRELDYLERADFSCFVHAHVPIEADHLSLIQKNRALVKRTTEAVYDFCGSYRGREEIVGRLFQSLGIREKPSRFMQAYMSVGAHLSYLVSRGELDVQFVDGILKYRRRER